MNAHLPNSLVSNALREVAMVAEIKTTSLGLTRTDKQASAKTTNDHHAASGAARVLVSRLAGADDIHRDITSTQEAIRGNLHAYSTTWGNSSRRLLPNSNFEPWIREHARLKGIFDELMEKLKEQAPHLVQRAMQNLGQFNVQPPSVDEILNAYSIRYNLEPIPDGQQFNGLPPQVEAFLRAQFEENMKMSYREAQQDALSRLAKPLASLVERIGAYEEREQKIAQGEDVGKSGIFRDTLITNVQDIAHVFGSFNLTGDPILADLNGRLDLFLNIKPDDLRKNPDMRKAAKEKAEALIADLNDILMPTAHKAI
jgi:hypothetical protein